MTTFSERIPPHDLEAEQSVIGACLIDKDVLPVVRQHLAPEDFYADANAIVYRAILAIVNRKEPVDLVTVPAELKNAGQTGHIGDLTSYMNAVPTTANAEVYALMVAEKASMRRIQKAAMRVVDHCYTAHSLTTLKGASVEELHKALFNSRDPSIVKRVGEKMLGFIEKGINNRDEGKANTTIVPTGFKDQDMRMPLERGTVTVVPSPSGIGKTTWMFQLLLSSARLGEPCIGFSLEMSETQILQKVWANVARLNTMKIRHQSLSDEEWNRSLTEAYQLLDVPFHYALKRRMRFADIRLEAMAFRARHGKLSIVAIDYWQIIGDRPNKDERKDEMLGRLVEEAKDLAVECDCHVVILAQAKIDSNRPVPALEDVKESRAIVAAADNILFLTRPLEFGDAKIKLPGIGGSLIECRCNDPDSINPQAKMFDNVMLGIPGKARMGPKDIIPYYCELETGRMGDLARPWPWDNSRGIPRKQEV